MEFLAFALKREQYCVHCGHYGQERARPEVPAPWIIKVPYFVLCYFLDAVRVDQPRDALTHPPESARSPPPNLESSDFNIHKH